MQNSELKHLEEIISKLDENREYLLKNIDGGMWPELRVELAEVEREISKLILKARDYSSDD